MNIPIFYIPTNIRFSFVIRPRDRNQSPSQFCPQNIYFMYQPPGKSQSPGLGLLLCSLASGSLTAAASILSNENKHTLIRLSKTVPACGETTHCAHLVSIDNLQYTIYTVLWTQKCNSKVKIELTTPRIQCEALETEPRRPLMRTCRDELCVVDGNGGEYILGILRVILAFPHSITGKRN